MVLLGCDKQNECGTQHGSGSKDGECIAHDKQRALTMRYTRKNGTNQAAKSEEKSVDALVGGVEHVLSRFFSAIVED